MGRLLKNNSSAAPWSQVDPAGLCMAASVSLEIATQRPTTAGLGASSDEPGVLERDGRSRVATHDRGRRGPPSCLKHDLHRLGFWSSLRRMRCRGLLLGSCETRRHAYPRSRACDGSSRAPGSREPRPTTPPRASWTAMVFNMIRSGLVFTSSVRHVCRCGLLLGSCERRPDACARVGASSGGPGVLARDGRSRAATHDAPRASWAAMVFNMIHSGLVLR